MWPLLLLGGLGALLAGGASKPAPPAPTFDLGSSFLRKYGTFQVYAEPASNVLFAVSPEVAATNLPGSMLPGAVYQGLAAAWYAQQKLAGMRIFTSGALPFPVPGVLIRAGAMPYPTEVEET